MKLTDWKRIYDSDMNIAIEQRKAIYVYITRVQLTYFSFVIGLCSVSSLHSASFKLPDWDSVTVVLVSLP